MCHIGGVETVALMSQILDTLRAGDILTHAYSGAPNNNNAFTNIVQDGKLLPAALEAKRRGVIFDVGHGGGSYDFTVCEAAIQQGAGPDTISSDIHVFSGNTPGMPYLTWVMSKFLTFGFTLEQVVTMATTNPAKVINRMPKLGTLAGRRAGRCRHSRSGRGAGLVRRHAQQQARRQGVSQAGTDGRRRRSVRPAVSFAVRGEVTDSGLV